MADDSRILELFFERSEQAIQELDVRYGKICYMLSYNIVNNRMDAEECVNEAYLGVWNTIPPARPSALLPYVAKIVRNISLNRYWKNSAAKRDSRCTVALQEIGDVIADRTTVEDEIQVRELARMIGDFLETLSRENRIIFIRRYWFLDSYKDISDFMNLSEKTISVRLTRIRKKLKRYLKDREVFL